MVLWQELINTSQIVGLIYYNTTLVHVIIDYL